MFECINTNTTNRPKGEQMLNCKFCDRTCKNENSLRNHQRLCKSNPERDYVKIDEIRKKGLIKIKCIHCEELFSKTTISRHEKKCNKNPVIIEEKTKICPVCNNPHMKSGKTCSHSCSNTYYRSGKNNGMYKKGSNYRTECFLHHEKKCIVCGEDKIVSVHHYDHNHENNDPSNLIPLCPTHHQYVHSKYVDEVLPIIIEYRQTIIQ